MLIVSDLFAASASVTELLGSKAVLSFWYISCQLSKLSMDLYDLEADLDHSEAYMARVGAHHQQLQVRLRHLIDAVLRLHDALVQVVNDDNFVDMQFVVMDYLSNVFKQFAMMQSPNAVRRRLLRFWRLLH